jgi:ribonucleotide reductase beta subunit family protein with ferritin-like domain
MANDIDYLGDVLHWKKLDPNVQLTVIAISNFFVNADQLVAEVIEHQIKEALDNQPTKHFKIIFELIQAFENIHNESYSRYVDEVIRSTHPKVADEILAGTYPIAKDMIDWCKSKYKQYENNLSMIVVIHSIVEGVFFTGPFAFIDWLKERLPNLKAQNKLISRDEGKHVLTDQEVLRYFGIPNEISALYKEGVDVVSRVLLKDILTMDFPLMTREMMLKHIKFVANAQLGLLNLPLIYPEVTTTDFHSMVSFNINSTITDFFEATPSYNKSIINDGLGNFG